MAGLVINTVLNGASEPVGVIVETNDLSGLFGNTAKCLILKSSVAKVCVKATSNPMIDLVHQDGSRDQVVFDAVESFDGVTPQNIDGLFDSFVSVLT